MSDSLDPDALDPQDETIPVSPARRRLQIAIGLVLVAVILVGIVWFALSHTETDQGPIQADPPEVSLRAERSAGVAFATSISRYSNHIKGDAMRRYAMDYGRASMGRGGMRRGSEYGGYGAGGPGYGRAGVGREEAFRGRGQAYDTYFRRDFQTNQGDFTSEFGGGPGYGYRGVDRNRWRERMRGGSMRGYGADFDRGFRARGPEYGGSPRRTRPTSYGPGYGDRWETTAPEDIPERNFRR